MKLCVCGTGGGNTGLPNCYPIFDVTKQAIFVEYRKADGSVNGLDLSALTYGVLDQTFLDSKVKDSNPLTRWYPSPELKNIVDERSDDITEEFEDGTSVFIQEGARTFEGMIIKGDPILLGNLQKWRCLEIGVYFIDKSGNLIGKQTRDGYLDPILIQKESFSPGLMKGTDTTIQKNRIRFTVSSFENDANLRMIEASKITADLLGVNGLIDVVAGTPSNITTTGFGVQLNTNFGGVTSKIPATGLELTDFQINEVSPTPGPVTITSVTESTTTPGLYTFVFPAATSGDVLEVSNASGVLDKNYDVAKFQVTIP